MEIIPSVVPAALLTLPFLVCMAALHFILFRPLFDYLDERDALSRDARAEAERVNARADESLAAVVKQLAEARKEATELRQQARGQARAVETDILAQARQEADATVTAALEQIAADKDRASATLRGTAQALSQDIAAQVLGRPLA